MRRLSLTLSAISALAMLIALAIWIPDTIVYHYDIHGMANQWGSKWWYALIALLPLALALSYECYRHSEKGSVRNRAVEDRLIPLLPPLFILLGWVMLLNGVNNAAKLDVRVGCGIIIALGLVMIVFSNYNGKIRQNRHMGIRTPWTLKNEQVWKRTHRLSGFAGVAGGLIMMVSGAVGMILTQHAWIICMSGLFLGLVLIALLPITYSYIIYKKIDEKVR